MAELSQIKLPNNATYDLRDRKALPLTGGELTGALSGPNAEFDEETVGNLLVNGAARFLNDVHGINSDKIEPIDTMTYTDIIGSANDFANATFYFGTVLPTSWYAAWHVKYRIHAYVPGQNNFWGVYEVNFYGSQATRSGFTHRNFFYSTSYRPLYYHTLYSATQTGYNAGYGHLLGIGLRSANSSTNTACKRTFVIELVEQENCKVTMWNAMQKFAAVPGTGSTNYSGYSETNGYDIGVKTTGDGNDTTTLTHSTSGITSGPNGIMQNSLIMQLPSGRWESFTTTSGIGTTKTKNASGFLPYNILYYASGVVAPNTRVAAGPRVHQDWLDSRYTLNAGQTLTADKKIYIKGTIRDGLFYLVDDDTYWTQDEPTTADGIYYIPVGMAYNNYAYCFWGWNGIWKHNGNNFVRVYLGEINNVGKQMYLFQGSTTTQAQGALVESTNRAITEFIDLQEYDFYVNVGSLAASWSIWFYDENMAYISWSGWIGSSGYTVPSNARYVRLSFRYNDDSTIDNERLRELNNCVVITDITKTLKFGTAAYTSATDYAPKVHRHSPDDIDAGYFDKRIYYSTHPESNGGIIPFIYNDLAFLTKKGGSYTYYTTTSSDYTAETLDDVSIINTSLENVFDASPKYATPNRAETDVCVIDIVLPKPFSWSNVFYIDFGATNWRAKSITVLARNTIYGETEYTQKAVITDNSRGHWWCAISHDGINSTDGSNYHAFNNIRVVLTDFYSANNRIAQIGLINYDSKGVHETFISRGGCDGVYGDILPYSNGNLSLGSTTKKWKNIYTDNIAANNMSPGSIYTNKVLLLSRSEYWENGTINGSSGQNGTGNVANRIRSTMFEVLPGETYTIQATEGYVFWVYEYQANGTFIRYVQDAAVNSMTYTAGSTVGNLRLVVRNSDNSNLNSGYIGSSYYVEVLATYGTTFNSDEIGTLIYRDDHGNTHISGEKVTQTEVNMLFA